jgi:hypothetical protein
MNVTIDYHPLPKKAGDGKIIILDPICIERRN